MRKFIRSCIGDKAFYKMVFLIAIPIMLQNALTNVVGLLDNVMVGQLGTNEMSGVSIANNLMFVFIIVCFGAVSGAGIFSAQYFGKGDMKGMGAAFRVKLYICTIVTLCSILIFLFFGDNLIGLYLHDVSGDVGDPTIALSEAHNYLNIMLIGLPFLAFSMCYASTLREAGQTVLPMISGIIAVFVDLIFNYLLIFGHFGFPELGVKGAAIATVMSRFVEFMINVIYTHVKSAKYTYVKYTFNTPKVPGVLLKGVFTKGLPLVVNEALWVTSITFVTQCYSSRGLAAVSALNINSSITNVFNTFFLAMGSAVSIIVGQLLGSDKLEEAKTTTRKLIAFTFGITVVTSAMLALSSGFFPGLYNTEPIVKDLATKIILVNACFVPFQGICHSSYFALRSGGKTWLTFLFDSGLQWVAYVPIAYALSHFTTLPVIYVFAAASLSDVVKCFISLLFISKSNWAQNIVKE